MLDQLATQMSRAAEDPSADAVHDLRVAVRRASQALRLFETELPAGSRRLRREIRAIRARAAAVRDRDVTGQLLRRHRLPSADPARVYLSGQRDLAAQQLRDYLERRLKKERPRKWQEWLGAS